MDDHILGMLGYAAAVQTPLRLKVRAAGQPEEQVDIPAPLAIIGRGTGCQIQIPQQVSYRHCYLQAIGTRVACIDLHSATGIQVDGPEFTGWLSAEHTLKIGDWTIRLADAHWNADSSLKSPLDFRPRDEHRNEYGSLPKVELELLNTSFKGQKWPINRIITLLGRDERCRITVLDERLSRVHCSFLLLPSGLWAIDLLGKGGIRINEQPFRCALISEGSELAIGPYKLTARYPQLPSSATTNYTGSGSDFLTRQNKIFAVEFYHDTVIIVPQGGSQSFFYNEIHIEASRVMDVIAFHGFKHVVVDFSRSETIGHNLLESLNLFCRAVSGKSALCSANAKTYSTLKSSSLMKLFDHYATRQDALQAVYY